MFSAYDDWKLDSGREYDDQDYYEAKRMAVLSDCRGCSDCKYCELIENRFVCTAQPVDDFEVEEDGYCDDYDDGNEYCER